MNKKQRARIKRKNLAEAEVSSVSSVGNAVKDTVAHGEEEEGRSMKVATWIQAGCTFVLVFITAYYAWYEAKQTNYLVNSDRPWVGFESGAVDMNEPGKPIERTLVWKNGGNSPAFDLHWREEINVTPGLVDWNDIQQRMDNLKPGDESLLTLLKDLTIETHRGEVGPVLTEEQEAAVKFGSHTILFYGKVLYKDGSGGQHTTTFCRRFEAAQENLPNRLFPCNVKETAS